MKDKYIPIITILFLLQMGLASNIAISGLTGKNPIQKIRTSISERIETRTEKKEEITYNQCSYINPIPNLDTYEDNPYIMALDEYQNTCGSFATNKWMIFTDMPKDNIVAQEDAKEIAKVIKEFNEIGVEPIIIIEPVTDWGLIDFEEFKTGFYDEWIKTYFKTLKEEGLTDENLGTWIPFPEANLPYWNHMNTKPEDFAIVVNKYLGILKEEFPETKTGILLNSATYETDDFEWSNGEYISLLPYVKDIDKNLIDTFGLQGFPWAPAKNSESAPIYNAAVFLNHTLAKEAATILEVEDIWLNTGTFKSKYTLDEEKKITVSSNTRMDILNGILIEANKLEEYGFNVTLNIFAENKSNTAEATDWSYDINEIEKTSHTTILMTFINEVYKNNLDISFYDAR